MVAHRRGWDRAAPGPNSDLPLDTVRESVLARVEADLIGTTRLEDVSIAEWAAQCRITPNAACKVRRRAEARLIALLREESRDASSDDPVLLSALHTSPSAVTLPARRDAVALLGGTPSMSSATESCRAGQNKDFLSGVAKSDPDSGLLRCGGSTPSVHSSSGSEMV
ncbi:hypothetical protein ACIQOU_35320 [Streptomyces sp. NPDC091279]|uniref:hypothetical protein n=1 Tax=unclassified Streptomyces TaxID=2593676 RepID=UPI0037F76BE9